MVAILDKRGRPARNVHGRRRTGIILPVVSMGVMNADNDNLIRAARDVVASLGLSDDPCGDCGTCKVRCFFTFDVRDRVTDIARITYVPENFLV